MWLYNQYDIYCKRFAYVKCRTFDKPGYTCAASGDGVNGSMESASLGQ